MKNHTQIVAFENASDHLAVLDERKKQAVGMKFFGGLNIEETAEILELSSETVKSGWHFARNRLLHQLARAV